jgi:hypothetical protein
LLFLFGQLLDVQQHPDSVEDGFFSPRSNEKMRALIQRAFSDPVSELDMYGFIQAKIFSRGRYGRAKEVTAKFQAELLGRLKQVVLTEFNSEPGQKVMM